MGRSTDHPEQHPADNEELAQLCLWEAGRTLDRDAAQSLRALEDRFRRMPHDRR
jgi:hypothetical protein